MINGMGIGVSGFKRITPLLHYSGLRVLGWDWLVFFHPENTEV